MKHNQYYSFHLIAIVGICVSFLACKKFVEIPEPGDSLTTEKTFENERLAEQAVLGIYGDMAFRQGLTYTRGGISLYTGLSSDELNIASSGNTSVYAFQINSLIPDNENVSANLWDAMYSNIYSSNAVIEGINASKNITGATKNQLIGEAKFIRAFCHFYLTNLFGDVPVVTSTDWQTNLIRSRDSSVEVYQQIITDLLDAQSLLMEDYSLTNGERVRVNKYAATALLARVYLYTGKFANAEAEANKVIQSTLYQLTTDLDSVFLANNREAIWQLQPGDYYPNAVLEAGQIIPYQGADPEYFLTDQLHGAFETSDERFGKWVDTSSNMRFYPFKYKITEGSSGSISPEYQTILRLAEQYLIRAEARFNQQNLTGAISDINIIRNRAHLPLLSNSLTPQQVMDAIEQENKIEFFAEWGHRWLDLKRWGKSDAILGGLKGSDWQATDKLYPIPLMELKRDPMLTQNDGYN